MSRSSKAVRIAAVLLVSALPLALLAFLARSASASTTFLHVKPGGLTSGSCSDWSTACDLQYALTNAITGTEIWVAEGVYTPGVSATSTFQLKSGVALYGGFAMTETAREQRNWQSHFTVLSGDLGGDDVTDAHGVVTDVTELDASQNPLNLHGTNAYHVVTSGSIDPTAVLDGFTITAGNASGNAPDNSGGGFYCVWDWHVLLGCSPTLANLTFSGNAAQSLGGGMYSKWTDSTLTNVTFSGNVADSGGGMYNIYYGSPVLTNVTFSSNVADYGGGLYNFQSGLTLANATFSGNTAQSIGGGLYTDYTSATLTNVIFNGNSTAGDGGGMFNSVYTPTLTNVIFNGNSAANGGGLFNLDSNMTLTNITFSGNSAADDGGGMYIMRSYSPTLTNITFSGNIANFGGGLYNTGEIWATSNPILTNVSFSGNRASFGGGLYNADYSHPDLRDSILWGDSPDEIGNADGAAVVSYSLVQGGYITGTAILDSDPLFRAPVSASAAPTTTGNLRLQFGSPAIDAGDPNTATLPLTDLDGHPRIASNAVDMGAYEYQPGLQISQQASANPVIPGSALTYTLSITNVSAVDLHAIITDALPSQVTPAGPLTWSVVITAPGGVWTQSVVVTVTDGYSGTLTNTVTAVAAEGADDASTLTTQSSIADQVITFDPLADKTLGDPPFSITATASSGLPVTFTTGSQACTVVNETVTLVEASQCIITAHQAGNLNYFPAPDVTQSFTVYAHIYLPVIMSPASAPYPYVMQNGRPTYMANWANTAGCNWLGIAGQVFDLNGRAVQGLYVHQEGGAFIQDALTGSKPQYGVGGYEIFLADHVFNSTNTFKVQLRDGAGNQISDWYIIPTYEDCNKNMILVNFVQDH